MNAQDNKTAAWLRDFLINQLEVDLEEPTLSNAARALGLVRRLIKENPRIPEGPRKRSTALGNPPAPGGPR